MIIFRVGEDFKKREKFDRDMPRADEILSGEGIYALQNYLGIDLFGNKKVIKIEDWDRVEEREFIYKYIDDMVANTNTFVFDELKVLPATVSKFERLGAKVLNCVVPENKYNTFDFLRIWLIDKNKNKKDIWLEFLRLQQKVNFEEFTGAFTWFISDNIAKRNFAKYNEEKLKDIFYKFLMFRKDGYREGENFWPKVERLILEG